MSTSNQPNLSQVISLSGTDFTNTQNMGISNVTSVSGTPVIENTVDYSESYPQSVSGSGIDLNVVAGVLNGTNTNFNNAQILNWVNTLTGANLNSLPPLSTIIEALVQDGFVTLTGPSTSDASVSAFQTQFDQAISGFKTYLQQHPTTLNTPQDYTDAFYAYLDAQDVSGSDTTAQEFDATFVSTDPSSPGSFTIPNSEVSSLLNSQGLLNQTAIPLNGNNPAFVNQLIANFMAMLQHSSQDPNDPYGADLVNASSLTSSEQADLYNNSLGTFLQYVSTQTDTSSGDFFQQWQQGAVAFAMMNYPTTAIPSGTVSGLSTSYTLYKELWDTYFPNDQKAFLPTLLAFISSYKNLGQSFVATGTSLDSTTALLTGQSVPVVGITSGTLGSTSQVNYSAGTFTFDPSTGTTSSSAGFTPSGALSQWGNLLRISAGGAPGLKSTSEGGFDQVQLILEIYDLLLNMLNSLQVMTAAQLERQTFYGAYQSVYTQSETSIAQITGAQTSPVSGYKTGSNQITQRSDMSQLASQFTESVKSFRSEINDLSSQQNTAVNQTQEATSQQVNLAQTLIQQFSTILQSIWR